MEGQGKSLSKQCIQVLKKLARRKHVTTWKCQVLSRIFFKDVEMCIRVSNGLDICNSLVVCLRHVEQPQKIFFICKSTSMIKLVLLVLLKLSSPHPQLLSRDPALLQPACLTACLAMKEQWQEEEVQYAENTHKHSYSTK